MNDKRHFQRVRFDALTEIVYQGQNLRAHVLDISLKGVLLETSQSLEIPSKTLCTLQIHLHGEGIVLAIEALLLHRHENQWGFKFHMMDVESLMHLRRLLELNLGEDFQPDREFFFFSEGE